MDYFNHLLSLLSSSSIYGYGIVAVLSFFESFAFVGILVPGSISVIAAGFLASQGYFDVGDLFLFSAVGAILGDSLSYSLGKRGIILFKEGNKVFKPSLLKKGEEYFQKHGSSSVFWGRFIGWVRPIIPYVAGLFQLNRRTFLLWNILSGIAWAISHIAFGYFFGHLWKSVSYWSMQMSIALLIIILLGSSYYAVNAYRKKHTISHKKHT